MRKTFLSAADVRKIRELVKTTPRKNVAAAYNISTVQVWRIATGRAYDWVTDDIPDHARYPDWKERDRVKTKRTKIETMLKEAGGPLTMELWRALRERKGDRLPPVVVKEMRRLADLGWPVWIIARRFNFPYHTVYGVVAMKTYQTVA